MIIPNSVAVDIFVTANPCNQKLIEASRYLYGQMVNNKPKLYWFLTVNHLSDEFYHQACLDYVMMRLIKKTKRKYKYKFSFAELSMLIALYIRYELSTVIKLYETSFGPVYGDYNFAPELYHEALYFLGIYKSFDFGEHGIWHLIMGTWMSDKYFNK